MTFTAPLALLLLLLIPLTIVIGFPRLHYRRGRDLTSLALRVAILTLLILSLAGVQTVRAADRLAVVFVIDVSDSMGSDVRAEEIAYIREALSTMRPEDQAAIVVFGADAIVERAMSSTREIAQLRSTPNTGNTDLEEAINLALALFPTDAARRMVILSDGQATLGDAERAARRAEAIGVEISYVPLTRDAAPEIAVTSVDVPSSVGAGTQFDLNITVESEIATSAALIVEAGGTTISRQDVQLTVGVNQYALTITAEETGFRDFRVSVIPLTEDEFYQNNQLAAFSRITGEPRVLVIAREAEEARYLVEALTELGLGVDLSAPADLAIGVAPLQAYNAVVLMNVPASDLPTARMEALQVYVRDLGGGLVVIGGPESYAPGGYFQTPLEETLPLMMQLEDQQRVPQLTMVYVIDRSGSMAMMGSSGVENIELAKEAVIRSVDFLQPTDRVGVVGFDSRSYWVADIQPVLNRDMLQMLIGTLQPGGGTDIMAGMRIAAEAMQTETTERRHIILLTDGGANDRGLVTLTRDLRETYDVTTSVIAIGAESPGFLEEMAIEGGGNYHVASSIASIPTIFSLETVLATRSYLIEETFTPALAGLSPILDGIDAAPPLYGYVATSPKQTAQVILVTPDENTDPILAAWQYGLGRSVAFTSDATARWGQDWVNWESFARFWSQAVRWTIIEGVNANLETRVTMEGETARITVDARGEDGGFLNGLALQASLVDPALGAQEVVLEQVAPGRYEAEFTPQAEGAYFVAVNGTMPDAAGEPLALTETSGWVMSYSPEYAIGGGTNVLPLFEEITGGRSLADNAAAVFEHTLEAGASRTPLAPILLLIALLLLPVDIGVRRLVITRSDLARLRAWLTRRDVIEASDTVSSLQMAKRRAQERAQDASDADQQLPPLPTAPPVTFTPPPREKITAPQPPETQGENLAGKLLQKRRPREDSSKNS